MDLNLDSDNVFDNFDWQFDPLVQDAPPLQERLSQSAYEDESGSGGAVPLPALLPVVIPEPVEELPPGPLAPPAPLTPPVVVAPPKPKYRVKVNIIKASSFTDHAKKNSMEHDSDGSKDESSETCAPSTSPLARRVDKVSINYTPSRPSTSTKDDVITSSDFEDLDEVVAPPLATPSLSQSTRKRRKRPATTFHPKSAGGQQKKTRTTSPRKTVRNSTVEDIVPKADAALSSLLALLNPRLEHVLPPRRPAGDLDAASPSTSVPATSKLEAVLSFPPPLVVSPSPAAVRKKSLPFPKSFRPSAKLEQDPHSPSPSSSSSVSATAPTFPNVLSRQTPFHSITIQSKLAVKPRMPSLGSSCSESATASPSGVGKAAGSVAANVLPVTAALRRKIADKKLQTGKPKKVDAQAWNKLAEFARS